MFFKKKINIILFLFLILTICFLYLLTFERKNINSENIDSLIKSNFNLTTHLGQKVNEEYFHGNHMLVYFGFTFCPDVCPNSLTKILETVNQLPDELQTKINVVFITVDPERDQPVQIRSFLENFNPSIIGLTGTNEEIESVVRKYRIYVKKNKSSRDDQNYLVDHSSLFFLVDKNDKYISHFRPDDFNSNIKSKILKKIF